MRALLRLLVPYSGRVALSVGLGATVIATNMGLLAAAAYLIAAASVAHLMALLVIPMYAVRILSATRGSARYAERLTSHRVTLELLARLRMALFDRFRQLGPAGLQGTHSGDALRRVMGDVDDIQNAYLLCVSPIVVAMIVSTLLVGVLLAFDSRIAWATLLYLLVGAGVLPALALMLTGNAGRGLVTARADLHTHLLDSIQGSRDILSCGAGPRFLQSTATHGERIARFEARLAAAAAGREGATELVTTLAMLTALALAVPLVTHHTISGLYIAVPALLTLAAFEGIRPVGQAAETIGGLQAASERVFAVSAETKALAEPQLPVKLHPPYSIAFEGVTLDYGKAGGAAIRSVDFEVSAGTRVAVVGPSGAGKTTLVRLLTRAWDPTHGRVLIGGSDLRSYALRDLRASLGVVAQDTYIFNDTVRSNLLLARPEASSEELEEALHAAGLLALVRALPQGLDTWVGEHGEKLSGGERQRLAVARVLLQDAPIVVLDEVTANLDAATEHALLDTLYRATEGRTVLVITHRLVELDRMDDIVVLDRGRIVERGTHAHLSAAGGLYRRMLDIQNNILTV